MDKFLQEKLMPIAGKLGTNKFLIAIRDGITFAMPLILVGSFLMIIASFPYPGWEKWLGEIGAADYLWKGVNSSFGLLGLVSSFAIAYSLTKQYKVDGVASGLVSLSAFVTVTPFITTAEKASGLPTALMDSHGLFVAIILGLINGYVYQWFINRDIQIKLPDGVPPAVSKSFSAIIPGAVIIVFWLLVFTVLDVFKLPNFHEIAQVVLGGPLGVLGNNIFGTSILVVLNSLFWFVGLHGGNIVNGVMKPIWLANLGENIAAHQASESVKHIFTTVFMDNFVYIGGGGATIGLVLALAYLARKKRASQQAKAMASVTLVPGLFNINEPTIFGLPIVLNVLLFVPFIVAPLVNLLIAYTSMSIGLVPLTFADPGWTMPPVISGLLATGSISGSVLQGVLILVDILLYLPFILKVEKVFQAEEKMTGE